jgi:hypothetical protein
MCGGPCRREVIGLSVFPAIPLFSLRPGAASDSPPPHGVRIASWDGGSTGGWRARGFEFFGQMSEVCAPEE